MKKLLTIAILLALVIVACKSLPPSPVPQAFGCACTIGAFGNTIVDAMDWTNPVTGHFGSGATTIHPELGSTFHILTDPSINCTSNTVAVAAASFTCHGTNMPYAIVINLLPNCNGVQGTVNGDCNNCQFSVSINTNAFWCNIVRPKK